MVSSSASINWSTSSFVTIRGGRNRSTFPMVQLIRNPFSIISLTMGAPSHLQFHAQDQPFSTDLLNKGEFALQLFKSGQKVISQLSAILQHPFFQEGGQGCHPGRSGQGISSKGGGMIPGLKNLSQPLSSSEARRWEPLRPRTSQGSECRVRCRNVHRQRVSRSAPFPPGPRRR